MKMGSANSHGPPRGAGWAFHAQRQLLTQLGQALPAFVGRLFGLGLALERQAQGFDLAHQRHFRRIEAAVLQHLESHAQFGWRFVIAVAQVQRFAIAARILQFAAGLRLRQ